jgi:hypothetical protein
MWGELKELNANLSTTKTQEIKLFTCKFASPQTSLNPEIYHIELSPDLSLKYF